MAVNRIRQAIRDGSIIRGVSLTFPAPRIVEVLAGLQPDFISIDGEHGSFDVGDIEPHCVLAERYGITPIARVPDGSRATITRYLDRGVRGILVPHVETVEDAKRAVDATFFSPKGDRSYGGAYPAYRLGAEGLPAFLDECNEAVVLGVMIESRKGLDAVGKIAAVEGIDYVSFGMNDFAQSLGYPGRPDHPEVKAAFEDASARIRAVGKPVREEFMQYAWIDDILFAGGKARLGAASAALA